MERGFVKREEFFKEMTTGLIKTLKTVYEPFVEDDLKKLDKTTSRLLGIKWVYFCSVVKRLEKVNQFYINGTPIIIFQEERNMRAISGICPECSNLLTLSVLFSTCKCLNCEKGFNFLNNEGDLTLFELPLTRRNDGYYVGLKN